MIKNCLYFSNLRHGVRLNGLVGNLHIGGSETSSGSSLLINSQVGGGKVSFKPYLSRDEAEGNYNDESSGSEYSDAQSSPTTSIMFLGSAHASPLSKF